MTFSSFSLATPVLIIRPETHDTLHPCSVAIDAHGAVRDVHASSFQPDHLSDASFDIFFGDLSQQFLLCCRREGHGLRHNDTPLVANPYDPPTPLRDGDSLTIQGSAISQCRDLHLRIRVAIIPSIPPTPLPSTPSQCINAHVHAASSRQHLTPPHRSYGQLLIDLTSSNSSTYPPPESSILAPSRSPPSQSSRPSSPLLSSPTTSCTSSIRTTASSEVAPIIGIASPTGSAAGIAASRSSCLAVAGEEKQARGDQDERVASALLALRRIGTAWLRARAWLLSTVSETRMHRSSVPRHRSAADVAAVPFSPRATPISDPIINSAGSTSYATQTSSSSHPVSVSSSPPTSPSHSSSVSTSVLTSVLAPRSTSGPRAPTCSHQPLAPSISSTSASSSPHSYSLPASARCIGPNIFRASGSAPAHITFAADAVAASERMREARLRTRAEPLRPTSLSVSQHTASASCSAAIDRLRMAWITARAWLLRTTAVPPFPAFASPFHPCCRHSSSVHLRR
ncbi:hypothetical protein CF319_g8393 [Tilletia indica]|nr:hypothetical protein CF319_g8393 [Tilletia indica]